ALLLSPSSRPLLSTLSLHDALPISSALGVLGRPSGPRRPRPGAPAPGAPHPLVVLHRHQADAGRRHAFFHLRHRTYRLPESPLILSLGLHRLEPVGPLLLRALGEEPLPVRGECSLLALA